MDKVWEIENTDDKQIGWECPACGGMHMIPTAGSKRWRWNGDKENPTIRPSLRVTWTSPPSVEHPEPDRICHFIVSNGKIDFCNDCTHEMKGKKGVEMLTEKPRYIK